MALKYMAGAMPSTPYTALNYLKGEAAKGAVRLMGQGDWTLETAPSGKRIIKAHSTLSNNFLHTLNNNKHDSWDITKPKLVLDHSYTISYPTASLTKDYKNRLNSDIIEATTHGIYCFTDGSKTEHGTDGGFVISDTRTKTITEHSFKMKDYCTVFQVVYKIPYRRAPRLAYRPSALREQRYLAYNLPGQNGSHQACCRRTHHLQQPTNNLLERQPICTSGSLQ